MMLQALASMMGITPDALNKEIDAFQKLASESSDALGRIETNTQENGVMLRAICAHLQIEVPENVRRNNNGVNGPDTGSGSGPG